MIVRLRGAFFDVYPACFAVVVGAVVWLTARSASADPLTPEALRELGMRGEAFACVSLGEVAPGPMRFEIWHPTRGTLLDGVNFMLCVTNASNKPARVQWLRMMDASGDYEPEFMVTDAKLGTFSYPLVPPVITLEPEQVWRTVYYIHGGVELSPNTGVKLVFRLHVSVTQQLESKTSPLRPATEMRLVLQAVNEAQTKAAAAEIVELAKKSDVAGNRARLAFLLARPERPQSEMTVKEATAAYEMLSATAPELAERVFDRLIDVLPQTEVVAYAVQRVQQGDSSPLPRCAVYLPTEAEAAIMALLDSPSAMARERALDALGARGTMVPQARVVALFNDPHIQVRRAAVSAAGKLRLPVADKLAVLLSDANTDLARDAVVALAQVGASTQLSAIAAALNQQRDAYLQAALIELAARNGCSPDLIRPFLRSTHPVPRAAAIIGLGDLKSEADSAQIATFLGSAQKTDVAAAIAYAGKLKIPKAEFTLGQYAIANDAIGRNVAEAMVNYGTPEALAVVRELAITRRVEGDKGLAQQDAVRAVAQLAPPATRLAELTAILKPWRTHPLAREEAVRQIGRLDEGVDTLKTLLDDRELGLSAMWELSRLSAPNTPLKGFVRQPLRRPATVQEWLSALDRGATWETDAHAASAKVRLDRVQNYLPLRDVVLGIARAVPGMAFILTDREIRFVPRTTAADFYRTVK